MRKSRMIAECLRRHAWWRLDRADARDDGRNARSAVALLDAAAYAADLPDDAAVIARLAAAGCFSGDEFRLNDVAERIVRFWHYEEACADRRTCSTPSPRPSDASQESPAQRDGGRSCAADPQSRLSVAGRSCQSAVTARRTLSRSRARRRSCTSGGSSAVAA